MKSARVICTTATERTILEWAAARTPGKSRPTLDEAASLALEEFANERRELVARLSAAKRAVRLERVK